GGSCLALRPRTSQFAEALTVDLGVNRGRRHAPVAEYLPNLDQRSTRAQQLRGCGVPKHVSGNRSDASAATSLAQCSAHTIGRKATRRNTATDEQPTRPARRPAAKQQQGDASPHT